MIANQQLFNLLVKPKTKKRFKYVKKRNYKKRDKGLDLLKCHCGCDVFRKDLDTHILEEEHISRISKINGFFVKWIDKETNTLYYNGFKYDLDTAGKVTF